MAIVTKPNTFVANELIDANQMNQDFDSIYGLVNGNLDASNISVSGLNDLTKFANEVVTQLKTKGVIYTQDLFSQSFFVSGGLATFPGSPLNQISVTTATAYIIQADGSYRRVILTGTTYTTASISATYYLDLQPDGTISWGTAHSGQTGYLSLATVTTNGSGNVSAVTDVRVLFAGMAWQNISKVGSSLADLATRSASDLTGTLAAAQLPAHTGEATSSAGSAALTLLNSAVIGKLITGYVSGAGVVAATDSILAAIQKLNGNAALLAPITSPTFLVGATSPMFSESDYRIRKSLGTFTFTNGQSNSKIDLNFPNVDFHGYVDVTITGLLTNTNVSGILRKRFALCIQVGGTIVSQDTRYEEVMGGISTRLSISDLTWDATASKFRIQIVNPSSSGKLFTVAIEGMTAAGSAQTAISGATLSAVYTTDSTVFPLPFISYKRVVVNQQQLMDSSETLTTYAGVTTTKTLDISLGNVFDITLTGAVTLTFSNPAPTGQSCTMTVYVRQDSTARVITYPASVLWPSGSIPVITTVSKTYILTFKTVNGGTTWYGVMDGPF